MKRYELLAEEIATSIRSGMLDVGDRLPSVRQISTSRGVSVSTVFEAYYLLEARGLIRARERSGYYVTAGNTRLPPEPVIHSDCSTGAHPVRVNDLVFSILESARSRAVVPLASAFPSPLLYPLPRLARSLARGAETMDPWSTVDDITPGSATLRRSMLASQLRRILLQLHQARQRVNMAARIGPRQPARRPALLLQALFLQLREGFLMLAARLHRLRQHRAGPLQVDVQLDLQRLRRPTERPHVCRPRHAAAPLASARDSACKASCRSTPAPSCRSQADRAASRASAVSSAALAPFT